MRKNSKKKKIAYAFIAPAIISILVFTVVPIIYTVFISFTNYNMYHLEYGWDSQLPGSNSGKHQ